MFTDWPRFKSRSAETVLFSISLGIGAVSEGCFLAPLCQKTKSFADIFPAAVPNTNVKAGEGGSKGREREREL